MVARKSSAQGATPQSTPTSQRTRKIKSTPSDPAMSARSVAPVNGGTNGHVDGHNGSILSKKGAPAKSKSKSKSKAGAKTSRPSSFLSRIIKYLTQLILLGFTLYTITVCPDDTYLEKPVCRTLTTYHRALWTPYIEPHLHALLDRPELAPHVAQIQRVSRPYVKYAQVEWKRSVTPRLRHLARQADPYLHRADAEYQKHLEPTVRHLQYRLSHYYRLAEPHVHNLARLAQHYWLQVLPHLKPLWDQKKNVTEWTQKHVVEPLGALKAEYVDSQVEKMLHKVEEVGEGKTRAATSTSSETVASSARVSTTFASAASVPDSGPDTVTEHAPEPEPTAVRTQKPIIPPGPIIPPAPPSPPQEPAAPTESGPADFDDDDVLDDFLKDLDDTPTSNATPEPTAQEEAAPEMTEEPVWEETEEERQARIDQRAAETAELRKTIMARMEKWEKQETDEGERQLGVLKDGLDGLRAEWLKELQDETGELRTELKKLKTESERVVKGTAAYAKKLMGGKSGGAEKVALFDNIVKKADKKFQDQASGFQDKVVAWATKLDEAEQALATKSFDAVDYISGDAQQDLGMDLSYLDDVTVGDWTRYHALMKTAQEYGRIYRSFADGTHPSAPSNSIQPALDVLRAEFDDFLVDFGKHLDDTTKTAMEMFTGIKRSKPSTGTDTGPEKDKASILPIVGKEDGKGGLQFEAAQGILGRSKEEVQEAAARAEAVNAAGTVEPSPSPAVGDKTTKTAPTAAVEEDIEARAAKFAESIQAKLVDAVKEEEAALSRTIEEAMKAKETAPSTRSHEEL